MIEEDKYTSTTSGIKISVMPEPLEDEMNPERNIYSFAYTIRIENTGDQTVQLLERKWLIKSADIRIGEVIGPGVVGVQPTLRPGESFTYTSGTVIHDPVGSMEGSYTFKAEDGTVMEIPIPRFELAYEALLN